MAEEPNETNIDAEPQEEAVAPKGGKSFLLMLQGLIINPSDSGGSRYLMMNIGIEAKDAGVLEQIDEMDLVIRDTILKQLSQRTVQELSDISLRDQIKEDLKESINSVLKEGGIIRLYFTQYVLQ